jgi:hypothetical protein
MESELYLEEAAGHLAVLKNELMESAIERIAAAGLEPIAEDIAILDKYFDIVVEDAIDTMIPTESDLELNESDFVLIGESVYLRGDDKELAFICESSEIGAGDVELTEDEEINEIINTLTESEMDQLIEELEAETAPVEEAAYDIEAILASLDLGEL